MSTLHKVRKSYTNIALIVFNTVLVFGLMNLIIWGIQPYLDAIPGTANPIEERDQLTPEQVKQIYPDLGRDEVSYMLYETWSRAIEYEPFLQFQEKPFKGSFVNVSEHGFRLSKNQGPWPLSPNYFSIFLFGGSTTFGYGVPDDQTIASYLQEALAGHPQKGKPIRVYNFGQGFYYSVQERMLFQKLLMQGVVPDMVIFVDGINDFAWLSPGPTMTGKIRELLNSEPKPQSLWNEAFKAIPLVKAFNTLKSKWVVQHDYSHPQPLENPESFNREEEFPRIVNRYFQNKRMVEVLSEGYGISVVFVWQPTPVYKYDLDHHLFNHLRFGSNYHGTFGYELIKQRAESEEGHSNFLWLADIQQDLKEPLYVDNIHYSSKLSQIIANEMAQRLIAQGFLASGASSSTQAVDRIVALTHEISRSPKAELFLSRGSEYVLRKQYDQAFQDFEIAIRLDPNNAFAYNNRGVGYIRREQYELALQDFNAALHLKPDLADAYNNRGKLYLKFNRTEEAYADFSETLRLDPTVIEAFKYRGLIGMKFLPNKSQACTDLKAACELGDCIHYDEALKQKDC